MIMPPRKPWEPSRMRMYGAVTVNHVLEELVGHTAHIESKTGKMLDAARQGVLLEETDSQARKRWDAHQDAAMAGVSPPKLKTVWDPWGAIDRAELDVGRDCGVVRCITELEKRQYAGPRGRCALTSLQKSAPHLSHGQLVVQCLLAYHSWATHSQERALAEVYAWVQRLSGLAPVDACELAQQFRSGESVRARKKAAGLYGDALTILSAWIIRWNAKCC